MAVEDERVDMLDFIETNALPFPHCPVIDLQLPLTMPKVLNHSLPPTQHKLPTPNITIHKLTLIYYRQFHQTPQRPLTLRQVITPITLTIILTSQLTLA